MHPARRDLRALVRLAWPVVAGQVGTMMLGIVDTWMVGRLGARELAAVALADVCLFGSLILGIGVVMGIDPIVSQAHGAGRREEAGLAAQRGIVLALLASLPLAAIWLATGRILVLLGQDPALAALARDYARPQVFSIAPFLAFMALRQYLLGRGLVLAPLWIILAANVANVFFNWTLVFGNLGFPALGIRGAGLATGLTRAFMLIALAALIFGRGLHRGAWRPWSRDSFRASGLLHVLRYGGPVAVQVGLEVWAFMGANVFAGWLGEEAAAAHIVVIKLASLAFMVPLGISVASATRVGNLLGAGDRNGAQRAAWTALGLGAAVMLASATVFVVFRESLARLFSDDAGVIALAAGIFPIAAAFQLFDGLQVVGGGILRGMGTPRPAAAFNLLGYYGIAFPLAYGLAFRRGAGLPGIWWGLAGGLFAVALCLVAWIARRGPAHVPPEN